ncbi:histone RNA hairpin-binding protein, putative [Babesia caballi]|uniref:Histone RNA hairpin-binding protein, putative n=1 Tax=Babesia caballi TaxID=5871 RepID=A0AAV4M1B3_BABCB|nr:histone RNA hairpin-binding protein, putative [Babesia caballi]
MRRGQSRRSDASVERGEGAAASEARAATRLKNINLTKLHASYERYLSTVPRELRLRELRESWHPVTPNHRSTSSISQWNREIGAWRRSVYLWNGVAEAQCKLLSEAARKGDAAEFLRICEQEHPAEEPPAGGSCDRLVDPGCADYATEPVLYKPAWFKGQITHAGFQTVDEADFLERASRVLSASESRAFRESYENYIRSYTDGGLRSGDQ